jgi:hypothetical protein
MLIYKWNKHGDGWRVKEITPGELVTFNQWAYMTIFSG